MLKTVRDLPIVSPLAGMASSLVGPDAAQLSDWTGRLVLDVRGRDSAMALRNLFVTVPEIVGDTAHLEHGVLAKLRVDRWVYIALSESKAVNGLGEQLTDHRFFDATHAYAILHLRGASARDVLAQLCALDFADRAFPASRAAQTSLAKVPALIVRLDDEPYGCLILVARSVAAYTWMILSSVTNSAG